MIKGFSELESNEGGVGVIVKEVSEKISGKVSLAEGRLRAKDEL